MPVGSHICATRRPRSTHPRTDAPATPHAERRPPHDPPASVNNAQSPPRQRFAARSRVPGMTSAKDAGAANSSSPPPPVYFGIPPYVDQAAARITRHFAGHASDALVLGIFGEWGAGKSTMLKAVGERFPNTVPQLVATPGGVAVYREQTLLIDFNAWRYEREEHLLIPLLKTVERTLADFINGLRAAQEKEAGAWGKLERFWRKDARDAQWSWLRDRAALLGSCVIALTKVFKLKAGVPGLGEVELAPYEALKAAQEQIDRAAKDGVPASGERALDSLYYDLHAQLHRLTRGDNEADAPRLNFVFLIDDLDRCLPDKAVEMLEAIKLFLDVEGCAFLLALDDEVIERGIAYRYRDYLDAADRATDSIAYSLSPARYAQYVNRIAGRRLPPITGHEYLEKIVQLPFRLPRWSEAEAREFLVMRFGELFERSDSTNEDDPVARARQEERRWLLDLFVQAVPPIPRKLVRAGELLEFVRAVARARGLEQRLQPYTAVQLTLLQLFAPQCFRFLRRGRLAGWLTLEKRLRGEPPSYRASSGSTPVARPDWRSSSFFDWWEGLCEVERTEKPTDAWYIENVEIPLIAELRQASVNRGGFDVRNLFLLARTELSVDERLDPYVSLFAEPQITQPTAAGAIPASPRNRERFVSLLNSTVRESWINAFEQERDSLQGRVLDTPTFDALLNALPAQRPLPAPFGADWLEQLAPYLTATQTGRLLAHTRLLERLAGDAGVAVTFASSPAGTTQASPS